MGDVSVRVKRRKDFNQRIADHKILRLHRNRRKEQHDAFVGKGHAERQEHTVASPTRPDRHPRIKVGTHRDGVHTVGHHRILVQSLNIILSQLPQFLTKRSANATNEIVDEETSLPHRLLNDAPKHPQREHVEQHVRPRSVQEHIGHHLPQTKIGRQKEVQTEEIGQHVPSTLRHELLHHEENNIDKQQVARYRRNRIEESVGRHVRECISPQVTHIELCATRGRNEKKRKSSVPRGRPQATLHLEKRRSPPDKLPEFRPPTRCARLVTRWIRIRTAQF